MMEGRPGTLHHLIEKAQRVAAFLVTCFLCWYHSGAGMRWRMHGTCLRVCMRIPFRSLSVCKRNRVTSLS
eukprot:2678680-Amphidinium_carterae.1